ncbi:MAG: hypothetical protein ABIJ56_16730 [Pseudomonadota bacterium]
MIRPGIIITFFLAAAIAVSGCKRKMRDEGKAGKDVAADQERKAGPPREYVGEIERLGKGKVDYLVVGIDVPSFENLSLEKKQLAYWLAMAAIAGNDIMYLQNHRFALPVKALLEDVYLGSATAKDPEMIRIRESLLDYLKTIWINHGQYDHRSSIKFTPNTLTQDQLMKIAGLAMGQGAALDFLPGKTLEEKLAPLLPHIFDEKLENRMTVTDPGSDVIAESFVNFYDPGIKQTDLDGVADEWKKRVNVRFALQDGKVVPQLFCKDCAYGDHIGRILKYLKKAEPLAREGPMRKSLEQLVRYFETGDEEIYREHCVTWIGLNDEVEYLSGFVEQLKDPRGVIGNFEGVSAVKADSRIVDRILEDGLYFEGKMPWPDKYKRDTVKKATAVIVEVLVGTGDMGPVPWGGYNLPNYDDIRKNYGARNVILLNIINSYSKTDRDKSIEEYYLEEYRPLTREHADTIKKTLTYLHEIIGHGSGKSDDKLKDDPRNLMGRNFSSLEECRADLVALYHIGDPRLPEYGIYPAEAAKDMAGGAYALYFTQHLQRMGSFTDDIVTEAHDRGRHLVYQYLMTGGCMADACDETKDFGLTLVEEDGRHFIKVEDAEKVRQGIGELLEKLQVAKATADTAAQDKLFDALVLDKALRKEMTGRKEKLDLPTQRVVVYPRLELVKDDKGRVVDVAIFNDEDLVAQQLRFSEINKM